MSGPNRPRRQPKHSVGGRNGRKGKKPSFLTGHREIVWSGGVGAVSKLGRAQVMTAGYANIGRTEEFRGETLMKDSPSAAWKFLFTNRGRAELPSRACASLTNPPAGGGKDLDRNCIGKMVFCVGVVGSVISRCHCTEATTANNTDPPPGTDAATSELPQVSDRSRVPLDLVVNCLGLRDPDARTHHLGLNVKAHREQNN